MKRYWIVTLLISFFGISVAHAETVHLGIQAGQMDTDDATTDNLGVVVGGYRDPGSGFGLEFQFSRTIGEDSEIVSGDRVDITVNSYGIYGVYKTATKPYVKGELGLAVVDISLEDARTGASVSDDETGYAYGVGIGMPLWDGNIELSYKVLPEIEDFRGTGADTEIEMIAISYLWNF